MKKVLLLTDSLNSGGAQRQLVGLAVGLKSKGYDVTVAYYYDIPFYADDLKKAGVSMHLIEDAINPVKRFLKVRKYIKSYNPDVVISYLYTPCALSCACKALGGKWKLIVGERNTTQSIGRREKILFSLYRKADLIVPNSFSQENFIKGHYPQLASKVKTITNFVDTDYFRPSSELKEPGDVREIICVGRISPQKNVLSFLEAIANARKSNNNFRVDWYGRCDDDQFMKEVNEKMDQLGIREAVSFHDPERDIRQKYCESDIFCLPSIYEGFPNVLCEAMSCGLPVISSNVCDNPRILSMPEGGILFDPHNVEAMADALIQSCSWESKELMEKGKFNREWAVANLSHESFIDKYIELL